MFLLDYQMNPCCFMCLKLINITACWALKTKLFTRISHFPSILSYCDDFLNAKCFYCLKYWEQNSGDNRFPSGRKHLWCSNFLGSQDYIKAKPSCFARKLLLFIKMMHFCIGPSLLKILGKGYHHHKDRPYLSLLVEIYSVLTRFVVQNNLKKHSLALMPSETIQNLCFSHFRMNRTLRVHSKAFSSAMTPGHILNQACVLLV